MTREHWNKPNVGGIGYRARLERFWAERPEATQEQARHATGAPRAVVRRVFDLLVLAGRLTRAKAMVRSCDND